MQKESNEKLILGILHRLKNIQNLIKQGLAKPKEKSQAFEIAKEKAELFQDELYKRKAEKLGKQTTWTKQAKDGFVASDESEQLQPWIDLFENYLKQRKIKKRLKNKDLWIQSNIEGKDEHLFIGKRGNTKEKVHLILDSETGETRIDRKDQAPHDLLGAIETVLTTKQGEKIRTTRSKLEFIEGEDNKNKAAILNQWFAENKKIASMGLENLQIKTFMEAEIKLLNSDLDISKQTLRDNARKSTIRTFGWPIGVFINERSEFAPKVDLNGIHAEIAIKEKDWLDNQKQRITYDYWAIHTNGAFYLLKSLFEDVRKPNEIFFNTRIVRITELLMYIKNLYSSFDIPLNAEIEIMIKHGGLKGRILTSSSPNRCLFGSYKTDTNEIPTTIKTTLNEIESEIVNIVEQFTKPLFEQFSFFELKKSVLEDIVMNFVNGKVV